MSNSAIRNRLVSPLVEVDSLMKQMFGESPFTVQSSGGFSPRTNVTESETHYLFAIELPGVSAEDVNVEFNEGSLVISGEKKVPEIAEGETVIYAQRHGGEFSRSFDFSKEIDPENIDASFKDGVLNVSVPKAAKSLPRKIDVKVS